MKSFVTAVVVANGDIDELATTLSQLGKQSRMPDRILIVETSARNQTSSSLTEQKSAISASGFETLRIGSVKNLAAALHQASVHFGGSFAASDEDSSSSWLWVLHDDSAPEPQTLERLLHAVETSPSVALVGPKQLNWQNPRLIEQVGLTLTAQTDIFNPARGQIDQSQHDAVDDVLAIGTAGMLVRVDAYEAIGGLDSGSPNLAADVDFGIRMRLAGYRVSVAAEATLRHSSRSLVGERSKRWLRGSPRTAIRKANIHLKLVYLPFALSLLYWVALPAIGILRSILAIAAKRPNRIWAELSAATWGFTTVAARFASRRKRRRLGSQKLGDFDSLRASRAAVKHAKLQEIDDLVADAGATPLLQEGAIDLDRESAARQGLISSGSIWLAVMLAALGFSFFPLAPAVTGGAMLPLSDSWFALFSHAGASYQQLGLGFAAPSDPFNWVLLAIGSLTPWQPSLALAVVLWLARSIAFIGAWKAMALITTRVWIRNLGALGYALWPAFTAALSDGRIGAVIAATALPWFVLSVARAAGLGLSAARRTQSQVWSWIGVAGLALLAVGVSAPSLIPLLLTGFAFVLFGRIRRFGYLLWIPLPLAAAISPQVWFLFFSAGQPLAVLADPGLPLRSPEHEVWQLLLGGTDVAAGSSIGIARWCTAALTALALASLLGRAVSKALSFWLFALMSIGLAWVVERIEFVAGSGLTFNGSPYGLLMLAALSLIGAAGLALDWLQSNKFKLVAGSLVMVLSIAPLVFVAATNPSVLQYTDGRVVPAIVLAEAKAGSRLKLLEIRTDSNTLTAQLSTGDGQHLDDQNLAYGFSLGNQSVANELSSVGDLVSRLALGSSQELRQRLTELGVGYVLLKPARNAAELEIEFRQRISTNLDSLLELESLGATDLGSLWRVREPNSMLAKPIANQESPWSITKGIQLASILGFVLLAIPSRRPQTSKQSDSEIFATDENEGDDFA